ncbi:MAG: hypothetical protein JNN22_01735 [Rhodospirillales bacterium]|nr:hypothetical protein [Rhodospirillales bacterium]
MQTETASPVRFDINALLSTPLIREPFEHVVVPRFVGQASLEWIWRNWPDLGRSGGVPLEQIAQTHPIRALIEQFEADEFREAVEIKFQLDLRYRRTVFCLTDRCRGPWPIHVNPPPNVVSVLFYPNIPTDDGEGDAAGVRFTRSQASIEDFVTEIPPLGGALAAFRCRPNAWHGRAPHFGRRLQLEMSWRAD